MTVLYPTPVHPHTNDPPQIIEYLSTGTAETFDVSWRCRSDVRPCRIGEAKALVISHHYLHKWPAVVTVRLGLYVDDVIRGVLLFGHGPKQISVRYGGMTWELSRLWIDDCVPRNAETWMIGKAIRYVRRNHREVKHIVSYADPSAGHTGTIYRAANFRSDGRTGPRAQNATVRL